MCPGGSKGGTSEGHKTMEVLETRPTKKRKKESKKKRETLAAILRRREIQLTGLGHFIGHNLRKSVK